MKVIKSNHKSKSQFDIPSFISVDEVYVSYTVGNKTETKIQASGLTEDRYLSTQMGTNQIKQPSFDNKQIYYCLLDGKLTLLPEATNTNYYTDIKALFVEDFAAFTNTTNIPITREYKDLLITLAALEAMTDIGRGDKVNLMRAEVNDNFRLFAAYATDRKNREGVQE